MAGKTVIVTRAAHQAPALSRRLRDLGARVLEMPTVDQVPASDGGAALAASVQRLAAGAYSWVIFTSANAVERLFQLVPDARIFAPAAVAAVGPATAGALAAYRIVADLVPADYRVEGLLACFPAPSPTGDRPSRLGGQAAVLLPQASGARPELARGLAKQGWQVDVVEAYRTVPLPISPAMLAASSRADVICFASPSAVNSYLDQVSSTTPAGPPIVVCIGPATTATARARGLTMTVEASEHTVEGLVDALVSALSAPGPGAARPPTSLHD